MANSSTPIETGAAVASPASADYRVADSGKQSEIRRGSLSEDFHRALDPWMDFDMVSSASRHRRLSLRARKAARTWSKQAGFFDLGISLLVLALSGGAVYLIEQGQSETNVAAQQGVEMTAAAAAPDSKREIAHAGAEVPAIASQ